MAWIRLNPPALDAYFNFVNRMALGIGVDLEPATDDTSA